MLRLPAQIHWFSIINSCVTVLLLTGFLATILMRVLKNDFIKYTRDDDGARPGEGTCRSCICVATIREYFQVLTGEIRPVLGFLLPLHSLCHQRNDIAKVCIAGIVFLGGPSLKHREVH